MRSKELFDALKKNIVAAYVSGRGLKKISKECDVSHYSTSRKIVYKWRIFTTTESMHRSGRSSNPNVSSQDLQKAVAMSMSM